MCLKAERLANACLRAIPSRLALRGLGRAIASLLILLLSVACTSSAGQTLPANSPPATPSPRVLPTRLLAELSGQLVRADGCFRVNTEQGSVLIGWTLIFSVHLEQGAIDITDTLTGEHARWQLGDWIRVGGAYPSQMDPEFRHGQPEHCGGPYFVMHTF